MRRYVFADEAGDFCFNRKQRSSRYFIICTVTLDSCAAGDRLAHLRRELVWEGAPIGAYFHACEDKQAVRDRVFAVLAEESFWIETTILEKSKAQPQARITPHRFYQYAWFYHWRYTHGKILNGADELLITAASVGTKKGQRVFTDAVQDVAGQFGANVTWRTNHPPSIADPCLQIADYCTWAIQRKWESADVRSYDLIKDKVRHEYDTWRRGNKHYY